MGVGLSPAESAAGRFAIDGPLREVRPHPGGHIHESFVVAADRRYLLQRLNTQVFPRPELVMENIAAVTAHLASRGERTLTIVAARDGTRLVRDPSGEAWRMYELLEGTVSRATARDAADAERAAAAFGRFQRALSDYSGPALHVTIPRFHDTKARITALEEAAVTAPSDRIRRARAVLEALTPHRVTLALFFGAVQFRYEAIVRIAHHDAKIANVLFDERTGEAVCVVDLDTVMPGLSLFDFGDLVRSMVSPAAEDERDVAHIVAEPARYEAIARGYLREMRDQLIDDEVGCLPLFGEAMVFEQAVRFLTDYLQGDRYYRIAREDHNLDRARAQLALLESMREQHDAFSRMVHR